MQEIFIRQCTTTTCNQTHLDVGCQCLNYSRPILGLEDIKHAALPGNSSAKGGSRAEKTITLGKSHGPLGGIPEDITDFFASGSVLGADGQIVLRLDIQSKGEAVSNLDNFAGLLEDGRKLESGNSIRSGGWHFEFGFQEFVLGKQSGRGLLRSRRSDKGGGGGQRCQHKSGCEVFHGIICLFFRENGVRSRQQLSFFNLGSTIIDQ